MVRRFLFCSLLGLVLLAWSPPVLSADSSRIEGHALKVQEGDDAGDAGADADSGAAAEPAAADGEDSDVELSIYRELKTVETQVDALKEKVFRSKARLLLLEEKVIRGVVSGAKAVLRHVNTLGPAYALDSITYYFDGNPIYQKTDAGTKGTLSKERRVEIFESNIPPGNHTLSVTGVIKGKGSGLFSYLSDYSFQFSSSYSFIAEDGNTTRLDSVLYKKGGILADYVEGPAVDFRFRGSKGKKNDQAEEDSASQ
jgi:hypothetical protein